MGAVASLLYASSDNSIDFIVAESPFSSLAELCGDLVQKYTKIPVFFSNLLVSGLRKIVLNEAGFDIENVNVLKNIKNVKASILLLHSPEDEMIDIKHSYRIINQANNASLIEIDGDHNKPRDHETIEKIVKFIIETFDERSFEEDIKEEQSNILPSLPGPQRNAHSRKVTDMCVGNYIPENKFRQALKELNPNV